MKDTSVIFHDTEEDLREMEQLKRNEKARNKQNFLPLLELFAKSTFPFASFIQ